MYSIQVWSWFSHEYSGMEVGKWKKKSFISQSPQNQISLTKELSHENSFLYLNE